MSDENWNKLEKNKRSYAFSKSGILPNPPPFNTNIQTLVDNKYGHIQRNFLTNHCIS